MLGGGRLTSQMSRVVACDIAYLNEGFLVGVYDGIPISESISEGFPYPETQCMVYLPTFTIRISNCR